MSGRRTPSEGHHHHFTDFDTVYYCHRQTDKVLTSCRSNISPCQWIPEMDLKSNNLSLNEGIEVAQNHPLWSLMSMLGATHSQWRMPEMKKK